MIIIDQYSYNVEAPAAGEVVYEGNGGVGAAASVAPGVPYPSTVNVNDILVLQVVNGANTTINTPSGWTKMAFEDTGGGSTSAWFWKRATGSETGSLTVTAATYGAAISGVISRFSGIITSGNPYNATTNAQGYATNVSIPAITTTNNNVLCAAFTTIEDNGTLGSPTLYTKQFDIPDSTGTRTKHAGCTQLKATAGSVAADSMSYALSDHWATLVMALVPA